MGKLGTAHRRTPGRLDAAGGYANQHPRRAPDVEDAAAAIEAEAPDAAERAFAAKTFVLKKAIENAEAAV